MKQCVSHQAQGARGNGSGPGVKALDFSKVLRSISTLIPIGPAEDIYKAAKVSKAPEPTQKRSKGVEALAEAMILQAIEDLWSKAHRQKSIEFFTGSGFNQCADMAGMTVIDRLRVLKLLRRIDRTAFDSRHSKRMRQISLS